MSNWFLSSIYRTLMHQHGFLGGYKDKGVVIIDGQPYLRRPAIITNDNGEIIAQEFFERLLNDPAPYGNSKEKRG